MAVRNKAARKPNILLLVLDTLRRDRLSIYSGASDSGRETSPVFDQFAHDATLYTRAVAPAQWTVPAHASLFTGVFPSEHGVTQSSSRLPDALPTAAEHLRAAGYYTAAFCNNPLVGVLDNGLQRGFDDFYNYASAVPHTPREARKHPLRRAFTRWFRPYARRIGNQFARSDTMFRLALQPAFVPIWSKYINFKGNTAASTRDLADFMQEQSDANPPWFAFVNLMGAHTPYHPPGAYVEKVAPSLAKDKHAYRFLRQFNADGAAWASPPEPPFTDWQRAALLGFYDAEIAYQDAQLARVFESLKKSGQWENTTVIVLADHGEAHGDHDLFGHGFNAHGELVHVPMAIHGERFPSGQVVENVSTRRIYHTLLDLAGVQTLDEDDPRNLSLAEPETHVGVPDPEQGSAFSEAYAINTFLHVLEHRHNGRGALTIERMRLRDTRRAVYAGDHKLIVRETGDDLVAESLYDIAHDPAETRDLLTSEPEQANALLRRARQFVSGQGHALLGENAPNPAPAYHEDDERVLEHLRTLGYIE